MISKALPRKGKCSILAKDLLGAFICLGEGAESTTAEVLDLLGSKDDSPDIVFSASKEPCNHQVYLFSGRNITYLVLRSHVTP